MSELTERLADRLDSLPESELGGALLTLAGRDFARGSRMAYVSWLCRWRQQQIEDAVALGGDRDEEERQWLNALAESVSRPEHNGKAFAIFHRARIAPRVRGEEPISL